MTTKLDESFTIVEPQWTIAKPDASADTGGIEGAKRTSRETMSWNAPTMIGPDSLIDPHKDQSDARGRDLVLNDGYMMGALHTQRDSIVGSFYRLNARPNLDVLKQIAKASPNPAVRAIQFTDAWEEQFQTIVEARFNLLSDSDANWLDVSRRNTLTQICRLGVGCLMLSGEALMTAEWRRERGRPYSTCTQMVASSRLSNPDHQPDTLRMRKGVEIDADGRPVAYHIQNGYSYDMYNTMKQYTWARVPTAKPWGRRQVLHVIDQLLPDQNRGISEMVSILKESRMTKKFKDVTLQQAILSASYAAAIESELPRDMIAAQLGSGQGYPTDFVNQYMTEIATYVGNANNIKLDGVKMPVFYPGTKLITQQLGTPGGIGTSYEESLLRNMAASFGMSYEEFTRDFTSTNYSSARAVMSMTRHHMNSKKKYGADAIANFIYELVIEEDVNKGRLPLPANCSAQTFRDLFYEPLAKEAICNATWIGASRGQIDEQKETQAAILRLQANMSTLEDECAILGKDYRDVIKQRAREAKMLEDYGIVVQPTETDSNTENNGNENANDE